MGLCHYTPGSAGHEHNCPSGGLVLGRLLSSLPAAVPSICLCSQVPQTATSCLCFIPPDFYALPPHTHPPSSVLWVTLRARGQEVL